jgi:MFS family permease
MLVIFRSLRHKPFALLWSGQTISNLGDSLYQVALAWWILQQTGSPLVMGTVIILRTVPMLLFALLGGVLVDRFNRLHLMLLSDLLRGIAVGVLTALFLFNALAVWHLYALSLLFGLVDACFPSAYRAVMPDILPAEALTSANSLTDLSAQFSGIAGPALAAFIVASGGSPLAFGLDALSFFISAACLLPLAKHSSGAPRETAHDNLLHDAREGLSTVFGTGWIWVTIAVAAVSNLTYAGPMGVALPFLIQDRLHADVAVLGLFYSFNAAGAVCGALWVGRQAQLHRRGLKIYVPWIALALMVMLIGLAQNVWLILVASFVIGLCNSTLGLVWMNALQECVPHEKLGRVSSIDYLGSSLLEPVGLAVGGWATQWLGPAFVFVLGGALQAGILVLGVLHPAVRKLD